MTFNATSAASPTQYTELAINDQTSEQNGRLSGREVTHTRCPASAVLLNMTSNVVTAELDGRQITHMRCPVSAVLSTIVGATMWGFCAQNECSQGAETAGQVLTGLGLAGLGIVWLLACRTGNIGILYSNRN